MSEKQLPLFKNLYKIVQSKTGSFISGLFKKEESTTTNKEDSNNTVNNDSSDSLNFDPYITKKIYIEDTPFSLRVRNALIRADITTLYDLSLVSDSELMQLKNFGASALAEIKELFNKCETNKDFWIELLAMNHLPTTYKYVLVNGERTVIPKMKKAIPKCKIEQKEQPEEEVYGELLDVYYEPISNIKGLSQKAKDVLYKRGIRKIGQLIQYAPEHIFEKEIDPSFDEAEEDPTYYNDIKCIYEFLDTKKIYIYPIKLSEEDNKKLAEYSYEEVIEWGWENIVEMYFQNCLSYLDQKRKDILMKRYGVYSHEQTLEEIGQFYKCSRERIRQLENKALLKFKHYMNKKEYIRLINSMTEVLFKNVGGVYKIEDSELLKQYLKMLYIFRDELTFLIDEDFSYVVNNKNWYSALKNNIYEELEAKNKIILSLGDFKEVLDRNLQKIISKGQEANYTAIFNDIFEDYLNNHLVETENNEYKIIKVITQKGKGDRENVENRNKEIVATFKDVYPNGVHLPLESSKINVLQTNLKPLVDRIPYEMSLRTLSEWVIKSSEQVILWDKGTYIHIDNVNVRMAVIDEIISAIIDKFDRGVSHLSLKDIYKQEETNLNNAGIPNYDALLGLIKYRRNPRISNKKYQLYDAFKKHCTES